MSAPHPMKIPGTLALLFGLMTIASGGMALFGSSAEVYDFGDVVPYVLWFNFLAGFAYVISGVGLVRSTSWGAWLAIALAIATSLVFALFGLHVMGGGAYEMRTVFAMSFRVAFWIAIASLAYRALRRGWLD